jgi:hypothetical protein
MSILTCGQCEHWCDGNIRGCLNEHKEEGYGLAANQAACKVFRLRVTRTLASCRIREPAPHVVQMQCVGEFLMLLYSDGALVRGRTTPPIMDGPPYGSWTKIIPPNLGELD